MTLSPLTSTEESSEEEIQTKRIIGHSVGDITSRYTHHRREVLLAEADRVSGHLAGMLDGRSENEVSLDFSIAKSNSMVVLSTNPDD